MSEYVIWLEDKRADVVDTDWIYKVSRPAHLQEPIVRCRDCRHFNIGPNTDCCGFTDKYAHPNGFCSWGEPRSDDR